jgi:transcriptional regulator with XRE-family HTH domain
MSKAGMTQEDVADRAGMKIEQVGRLVRGQNNPRLDTLKRLCVGLPVTLGELVTLTEKLEQN